MPEFLYIHIPLCIRKCLYCDFFSVTYDESLSMTYINALCRELTLIKNYANTLKTIYIGGGTPSLLPDKCFTQMFQCLRDNLNLSSNIEITVEANPGTINQSKIDTLLSLGVNRLSIGIQSFNDDELKTLGRIHTSHDAVKSVELIKNAGLQNFSIDLMYGIPGQALDSWRKSISSAVGFSPVHLSTYELTPEKKTPLHKLIISNKMKMPDEELILYMYKHAIDYSTACGYEHYEISNFALPKYRCIHNLNYWDRGEYIGVGAGAHSFVNGSRFKNTEDIKSYIKNMNNGISPKTDSIKLMPSDALKEYIFLGLRKTGGIDIHKLEEYGLSIHDASRELVDEGYIEIDNSHLRLTRKGLVISNTIMVKLFERLML